MSGQRSRPLRATTGARLAEAIAAEKLDEFGNPLRSYQRRIAQPHKQRRGPAKRKRATGDIEDESDVEDQTYTSTVENESDNDDDDISEVMEITNDEVSMHVRLFRYQ